MSKNSRTKKLHIGNQELGQLLSDVSSHFHRLDYLKTDPLEFVHRYRDPWDQEVVAVVSALLAYGNVVQIKRSLEDVLRRLGSVAESPAAAVRAVGGDFDRWRSIFAGFVHRFNTGDDVGFLFFRLYAAWSTYGSLGAGYAEMGARPGRAGLGERMVLMSDWIQGHEVSEHRKRSLGFLFASPKKGSASKRLCMLLRWMVRRDELDLGLWQTGSPLMFGREGLLPRDLVLPLDTHVHRILSNLGIVDHRPPNWDTALKATERLAQFDPEDPVRFDFALCRLGMLGYA